MFRPGTYARFNSETGDPILLYAIEFKFIRHGYVSTTQIYRIADKISSVVN